MKILIPIMIVLLGGCRAPHQMPAVEPLPVAAPSFRTDLRIPAAVVEYTLGAYVDPQNPLIRHGARRIQRIEKEARWDLRPTALVKSPSMGLANSSDEAPTVVTSASSEEPSEVLIPDAPPTSISPTAAVVEASIETVEPPSTEAAAPNEFVSAILPNASGVIDLVAIASAENPEVNPFTVRELPDERIHEIELKVGGIIQGPRSCILLNGRTVKIGEQFESLTLVGIEPDAALFRHREHLMRIPVSTAVTQIRLAL